MSESNIKESDRKKRYLRRYKKNRGLIERLKDKVESLDDRIVGLKSPSMSGMPRGGTPVTTEDLIAEKDEVIRRIKRLESKAGLLKEEILDKIDELEDSRYAEILESYFIDLKDFDTISDETGYTIRHVIRLYSEAINTMSI